MTLDLVQADVAAWQQRHSHSLELKTEDENSQELQSLIEKLPGLVRPIDWDVPADDGITAAAEWVVCGSETVNGRNAVIKFYFGAANRPGSEPFDALKDWESAVRASVPEGASGHVNMGLLRRSYEFVDPCGSKRRLSLGEFRDALNADINTSIPSKDR
ncbi:hypothetical protein CORC01_01471 [Colletotrichum orchidophilum]|uniref:Uncharacterized protein n=1 Tax=Colletotrichum orchidophilum TaxID=1209926 RepID=A0A1G4BP42_9PEZI|nr:uncharacterized protein CORC01_01471 [Colletotrichum orchidophilum]OHF03087.1 hypothetical protein CORC01_01471 [Colletotrichum orchidophilum]